MGKLLSRGIFGLFYILFIFIATTLNPYFLIIGFFLLFVLCFFELINMLQFEEKYMVVITFFLSVYLFYSYGINFLNGISSSSYSVVPYFPLILTSASYIIIFKRPTELAFDTSKLIFVVAYLTLPFVLFISLAKGWDFNLSLHVSPLLIFFIFLWLSDTMAYITGSLLGKTKMSSISQNKTWEGLIGGVIFVILAGILFENLFPNIRGNWIVISIIVAILAPLGDLAESKLKRVFGVKDTGRLLGEHGGLLDRLDSFLLASVGLYLYFLIYGL